MLLSRVAAAGRAPARFYHLALGPTATIAQQVWTHEGIVYGGVSNGLVHGESSFIIPKPQSNLIIGPYRKGDDSKIFIYPISTLLVRPSSRVVVMTLHVLQPDFRLRPRLGSCPWSKRTMTRPNTAPAATLALALTQLLA